MRNSELLTDAFGRVRDVVHAVVRGLDAEQLSWRADPAANSIAWLVWHLTRIQDDHLADADGSDQVWTSQGWSRRFDLPFDDETTGFGHRPDEVAAVRPASWELLADYQDAVYDRTIAYVSGLTADDLDRVVDRRWDPPVTLGVRLVSVIADGLQHAGQAAFVRGLLERRHVASS